MVWRRHLIAVVLLAIVLPHAATVTRGDAALAAARTPEAHWSDLAEGDRAHDAADYVASDRSWMRDFGSDLFRPDELETRRLFARALVRAFAKGAVPQERIMFADLPEDDPAYSYAAVAVERGWMTAAGGLFDPTEPVTTREVHRGLVLALGLRREAAGLARLHTADGTALQTPSGFGPLTLGMVLGLRVDNEDESLEVGPSTPLTRSEVAYSLWRAHLAATVSTWKLTSLAPYATIELPNRRPEVRQVVEFGARYVGYPYVWAGEWPTTTAGPYCCGAQPVGGFDCSGIVWWTMKATEGGYDNTSIRGYEGWSLAERSSAQMAAVGERLSYAEARPGDLLFFDGNDDGTVDHVSVFIGRGWALDSSNSYGGVSITRIGEGWYRERFTHARRIIAG